uniref:Agamous-like MADS-box protein AGL62 n=2 Tax=Cajanus cajan TaxID=3821 RepID=A0A151U7J8_CAJCA|nr:Agamous-like MADS-box protein AGL62 [Cajanus cajan]
MKKMSNESNLQVTFSKRRSGVFKKASELCTLCGTDVALIMFSPSDKVFSFGHPSVDAVIERYLARAPLPNSSTMQFIEAHRTANVNELNTQLTQINIQLDAERKRAEELARLKKVVQAQMWWASPIEEMSTAQLEQFKLVLEELKKHVACLVDRVMLQSVANPAHQFFPGASSSPNLVHQPQPPQEFPQQFIQPPMLQNYMFSNRTMTHQYHHGFNNTGSGGYGSIGGFF